MTEYYLNDEARPQVTFLTVPELPTGVVKASDFPVADLTGFFDTAFEALFPALGAAGVPPVTAPFSLHHRMPTDTSDFEAGAVIGRALEGPIESEGVLIEPATLPGGEVASISYVGPYEGLGEAWGAFMGAVVAAGRTPAFPFWEVYVTEPTPDLDPATLRTDLYTNLS